jgi:gluconate 2-dehydrogenase gamma chain
LNLGLRPPRLVEREQDMVANSNDDRPRTAYMFFTDQEARTVSAIAERIIPHDSSGAGASDADVIIYIDRALAGYGRHLQKLYRLGTGAINRLAATTRRGSRFVDLREAEQDELLSRLSTWLFAKGDDEPDEERTLLAQFFGAVRLHTIEGMFCDPMYGGNRDCVGWKLIGFPGAQWGYTAEQIKLGFDATTIPPKTLSELGQDYRVGKVGTEGGRK